MNKLNNEHFALNPQSLRAFVKILNPYFIMLKNGQTYFKNLAVSTPQDSWSMFGYFSILSNKGLKLKPGKQFKKIHALNYFWPLCLIYWNYSTAEYKHNTNLINRNINLIWQQPLKSDPRLPKGKPFKNYEECFLLKIKTLFPPKTFQFLTWVFVHI